MKTLVLVEHEGGAIKDATYATVTAASELGEVHLLVAGSGVGAVADAAARIAGAGKVHVADGAHLEHQLAEDVAPIVAALMADHEAFLASSTTTGKNVAPRVPLARRDADSTFCRRGRRQLPRTIYAGTAIATVKSKDGKERDHRARHRVREGRQRTAEGDASKRRRGCRSGASFVGAGCRSPSGRAEERKVIGRAAVIRLEPVHGLLDQCTSSARRRGEPRGVDAVCAERYQVGQGQIARLKLYRDRIFGRVSTCGKGVRRSSWPSKGRGRDDLQVADCSRRPVKNVPELTEKLRRSAEGPAVWRNRVRSGDRAQHAGDCATATTRGGDGKPKPEHKREEAGEHRGNRGSDRRGAR